MLDGLDTSMLKLESKSGAISEACNDKVHVDSNRFSIINELLDIETHMCVISTVRYLVGLLAALARPIIVAL